MTTHNRPVLVPLDGSPVAEQALPVGAALARRLRVPLHLVSVLEPTPVLATAEADFYGFELEPEGREALHQYLAGVQVAARQTQDLEVLGEVVAGAAAEALADYVEGHGIGLVVMTTHARKGLGRLVLGSVADRLLRQLDVPVLLLHPRELPQPTGFRRLLVALDGETDEPVLAAALGLGALARDAEYLLFRVAEPPIPVLTSLAASPSRLGQPHVEADVERSARDHLEEVANRLRAEGHRVSWRMVRARSVAEQVVDLAEETGVDCIVAGTHGAAGFERLLVGSVADRIVRRAAAPVLVVPARRG